MKAKTSRFVRALIPFMRFCPGIVAATIIFGVLSSLAEGIGISLFIPFLQGLSPYAPSPGVGTGFVEALDGLFDRVDPGHRLAVIAACILGSVLLKSSLAYGTQILYGLLDARVGHRLRSGLFEQLLGVGYRFWERNASDRLFNTLAGETWRASKALAALIFMIITTCTLLVYVALLLLISWPLTLLVAVAMLAISWLVGRLTRRAEVLGRLATRANTGLTNRMLEGFEGMKVIRAFGREGYEQGRFDRASGRVSRIFFQLGILNGLVGPVYELLAAVLLVVLLATSSWHVENLPALLVFIFILYRLQPRIKALDGTRLGLASLQAPVDEVTRLLDRRDKPYVVSGGAPFEGLRQSIRFEDVSFRYEQADRSALENVSVEIAAGRTTALVGPSGAGKSTFIKLLLRFYDATEGEIYVDGRPLRTLDLSAWRHRLALVSQDVYVFNTSVRENIAYGRLDATREEIVAAARLADAHDFISALPRGYQTRVGDRGVRLSGGQKQRITLARALLRRPDLLILDEATNALDSISENVIRQALDTLGPHCTVLIIAHRLATIEQADHIVVLEEGLVREQGAFDLLVRRDGLFAQLYHLQYRGALHPRSGS